MPLIRVSTTRCTDVTDFFLAVSPDSPWTRTSVHVRELTHRMSSGVPLCRLHLLESPDLACARKAETTRRGESSTRRQDAGLRAPGSIESARGWNETTSSSTRVRVQESLIGRAGEVAREAVVARVQKAPLNPKRRAGPQTKGVSAKVRLNEVEGHSASRYDVHIIHMDSFSKRDNRERGAGLRQSTANNVSPDDARRSFVER